jgi:methylenetetrahydrofolate reductase (NADH)
MPDAPSAPVGCTGRMGDLAELLRHLSYEVMPLRGVSDEVLANVPVSVPLTVTVTERKGLDGTLEVAEFLHGRGYAVTPHLAARLFRDAGHVADVVARLRDAGLRSVFVVGGDALRPAGPYPDAFALLQAMAELGHPFTEVGIAGYPEGHALIPRAAIDLALKQKAPLATQVITQICFAPATTAAWAAGIAAAGVELPVYVGMPGPVNRQRLVRISGTIGLGQSARFVRKQHGLLWRMLLPRGFRPTRLARRLGAAAPPNVRGLHIFTFNELRRTEQWRRSMLARLSEVDS